MCKCERKTAVWFCFMILTNSVCRQERGTQVPRNHWQEWQDQYILCVLLAYVLLNRSSCDKDKRIRRMGNNDTKQFIELQYQMVHIIDSTEDCLSLKGLKFEIIRTNSSLQWSKTFLRFSVTNSSVVVAGWTLEIAVIHIFSTMS